MKIQKFSDGRFFKVHFYFIMFNNNKFVITFNIRKKQIMAYKEIIKYNIPKTDCIRQILHINSLISFTEGCIGLKIKDLRHPKNQSVKMRKKKRNPI